MEFDCNYDFHKVVEEVLDEYEFDYEYKEDDDLYFSGVNYDDLGNVSLLIMNAGSRITLVGEVDYAIENELVYQRASDFVHRFNSMDCISTLFLDPESKYLYFKKNISVTDSFDPQFTFTRDFFRFTLEMDMFGKAIMGVLSGVLSDLEGIRGIELAIEAFNDEAYEEAEQFMN